MNFLRRIQCLTLCITGVIGVLPIASIADEGELDHHLSCVIGNDPSTVAVLSTSDEYSQFAVFEGLRKTGGQKWTQEVWGSLFREFSAELNAVTEPLRAEESSVQMANLRKQLKTRFSAAERSQICSVLEDSYFVQFQEKSANSARAVSAVLKAKASGRPITEAEQIKLMAQAEVAERDMQSFMNAYKERVSKLASSQAFQRWLIVVQEEGLAAVARSNRLMNGSPELKKLLAKWEARAREGQPIAPGR